MIISELIFDYIEKRGMTRKEFSEKTGIGQSTISDWKRKKTNPTSDKIAVICRTLGITPNDLFLHAETDERYVGDYIVIDTESEEYILVESYRRMGAYDKGRLMGYLSAINEKLLPENENEKFTTASPTGCRRHRKNI